MSVCIWGEPTTARFGGNRPNPAICECAREKLVLTKAVVGGLVIERSTATRLL